MLHISSLPVIWVIITEINDSDHLVGRTFLELVDCCLFISMIQSYTDGAAVPEMITVMNYQVLKGALHMLRHVGSCLCVSLPCSGSMQFSV